MPTIADLRGGTGLPLALEDTEHSAFIEGDTWAIGPLTLQTQDDAGEWERVDLSGASITGVVTDQAGGQLLVTFSASLDQDGAITLTASSTAGSAGVGSSDRPAMLHVRASSGATTVSLILAPITIRQAGA